MQPVLLDTSAIIAEDRWMASPLFRALLWGSVELEKKLVITHIVLRELEYAFRSDLLEMKPRLGKLVNPGILADEYKNYEIFLDHAFDDDRIAVADDPTLDLDLLVRNMYLGIKPFGRGGDSREKGFKDHIIWRSFLEFAKANETDRPYHFITGNYGKAMIHPDLRIEGLGIVVWESVNAFVQNEVDPHLASLREIANKIKHGKHPSIKLDADRVLKSLVEKMESVSVLYKERWISRIQRTIDIKGDRFQILAKRLNQRSLILTVIGEATVELDPEWKPYWSDVATVHRMEGSETFPFSVSYVIDEDTGAVTSEAAELTTVGELRPLSRRNHQIYSDMKEFFEEDWSPRL